MKQSIESVIVDLEAQRKRLDGSIEWTKNVINAVAKCRNFGQIEFTNVGFIFEDTTEVGIALSLPTQGMKQDVHVTTIVCMPTDEAMAEMVRNPAANTEALRLAHMLSWERSHGVKVLETWFVPDRKIWHESEQVTATWLTSTVREWMAYWFDVPPKAVYRKRQQISIESAGIRRPVADSETPS